MKKYLIYLGLIMISLIIITIKPSYGYTEESLNSNNLLSYLQENKLYHVKKICTIDYCGYLKSINLEKAIELFKKDYQKYLIKKTNEEIALSTILKGFPIIAIET